MIKVEKNPTPERLSALGVHDWPTWGREVSSFPWEYDNEEQCYLLEGDVTVTPEGGGEPVRIGQGDLVTFPAGMRCRWDIHAPVYKHYTFR